MTFYTQSLTGQMLWSRFKEYNDFLTGERRLADILSGYLDPETDEDILKFLKKKRT